MGRKRQPKQRELFLPNPPRGEAHERSGRDERPPATSGHERPTTPERLIPRKALPDQPNRLGTDPYARWCGRAGVARLPPIPIGLNQNQVDFCDNL